MALTPGQRKQLKGLAHHLKPTVHVGKAGLTDGLAGRVDEALNEHELIKVRFIDHKESRKEISEDLARRAQGDLVGVIGNIAMIYREHPEEEKRRVKLGKR